MFSGCGGLALGFQQAGFKITHGIELVEAAANTANYNLSIKKGEKAQHICGDITKLSPEIFQDKIGPNGCIVIGGPPCQAYSLAGRAKINSVREEGTYLDDKRGFLFEDFLRFGIGLDAKAIVMENVRQCVNYGKINVPERVAEILERHGYKVFWTVLNSADYGVPQIRERMILFAIKGDAEIIMPQPTHSGKSMDNLYAYVGLEDLQQHPHFVMPKHKRRKDPCWVTVKDAISDLPSLHPTSKNKYRAHSVKMGLPYRTDAQNEYQEKMRNSSGICTGHVYRNTPRDFPIFEQMQEGDNYVRAAEIAEELFKKECARLNIRANTEEYENLKNKIVPPYSTEKFLSKWKKMESNKPSYTLVAHLSVDTYSHIHPWEARGISVREAARLQSFPDDFIFQGNMGDAYKQIGNSVPPLMAEGIAKALRRMLSTRSDSHNEQ